MTNSQAAPAQQPIARAQEGICSKGNIIDKVGGVNSREKIRDIKISNHRRILGFIIHLSDLVYRVGFVTGIHLQPIYELSNS